MSFTPGEKVKHKSGGPDMVVKEVRSDTEIICQWIDHRGQTKEQSFLAVVLMYCQAGVYNVNLR